MFEANFKGFRPLYTSNFGRVEGRQRIIRSCWIICCLNGIQSGENAAYKPDLEDIYFVNVASNIGLSYVELCYNSLLCKFFNYSLLMHCQYTCTHLLALPSYLNAKIMHYFVDY